MENLSRETKNLLTEIEIVSNDEFVKALSFVTFYLRANPYNDEISLERHNWFETDNIVYDFDCTMGRLVPLCELQDKLLYDVMLDCDKILSFYFQGHLRETEGFSHIVHLFVNLATEEELEAILKDIIINERTKSSCFTSVSIIDLAKRILEIKNTDYVVDLCSGKGTFLSSVTESNLINGIEIDYENIKDSFILCLLSGRRANLIHQDGLTYSGMEFDKVFCEYPWSYIYNRPLQLLDCEKWKPLPVKDIKRSMTSWLFIAKTASILKKDGIAVVHCNEGALFSTYEKEIRELAVQKGLIKGVIALPSRMSPFSGVASSLLILSRGNEKIRFIDATDFGKINPKTKCVELSGEEIEQIVSLFNSDLDSKNAVTVDNKDIQQSYLNCLRYTQPKKAPVEVNNGKKVKEIVNAYIKSVISNSSYLTDNPTTGIKVLCSSDIKDGSFSVDQIKYLSKDGVDLLPKNWKQNILQDGDVIVTNKSTTIKAAITETKGHTIIMFGSLFGLRLKQELIIPLYLCGFINSNAGQLLLKSIQTGTIISMITMSNLNELVIPCPSISEQNKVCDQMLITIEMIREARNRIAILQNNYESFFDEFLSED